MKVFPKLETGTAPYTPTQDGRFPIVQMPLDMIQYLVTKSSVEDWASAIVETIHQRLSPDENIYVSIDCEWNQGDTKEITWVRQIKFPDTIEEHAVIIHLDAMQIYTAVEFPPTLRNVLELPCIVPVGVCVSYISTD